MLQAARSIRFSSESGATGSLGARLGSIGSGGGTKLRLQGRRPDRPADPGGRPLGPDPSAPQPSTPLSGGDRSDRRGTGAGDAKVGHPPRPERPGDASEEPLGSSRAAEHVVHESEVDGGSRDRAGRDSLDLHVGKGCVEPVHVPSNRRALGVAQEHAPPGADPSGELEGPTTPAAAHIPDHAPGTDPSIQGATDLGGLALLEAVRAIGAAEHEPSSVDPTDDRAPFGEFAAAPLGAEKGSGAGTSLGTTTATLGALGHGRTSRVIEASFEFSPPQLGVRSAQHRS